VPESDSDSSWRIVRAAAGAAARLTDAHQPAAFAIARDGALAPVASGDPATILRWAPGGGWQTTLPATDPRASLIELYLPVCSATSAHPITIGHLGQSLDGFIATQAGESRWVTGEQNMIHMHRLRALCDAVLVGAGTVAIDDPQLTTRLVPGPSPLRVVIDPERRLDATHRVFTDASVDTLYVCARSLLRSGDERIGHATIVGMDAGTESGVDLAALLRLLRARGCARVFVEGGGVTVSDFLAANLLDRLHIAIAPLLIGDGRPAIRIPPRAALGDCHRPRYRVFRMGEDILFDCDLKSDRFEQGGTESDASVTRVI
jgi:diaminohydroxyphosphoribosylaminopyrimidine deaminase/5-amino-6-(5-phosphoribosylamino)uracil reductase